MDTLESKVRKLAKSFKYQLIYSQGKNLNFNIFKNTTDFTNLQILFLYYLSFYSNLVMDYNMGEVDEIVFEKELYEDCYIMYKNKKSKKDKNETGSKKDKKTEKTPTSQWVFKNKKV